MSAEINFSALPNPYDFANPITEADLFAGRNSEISEIKYYLDHAAKALRPINLAILGARASGKTSLLNMIEQKATELGFCVVRINLDEGDVVYPLLFFHKIFDSILYSASRLGAYGGLQGKTFDTYRDMADAYEIPEDKIHCPFIFPIQYAKAMSKGQSAAMLSDAAFMQDLTSIQNEVKRPVILIFDEGDVLTKSRVYLEKIRNIFMNIPGYMLVLAGTPALFPLMDEVFSPIIRQFKKINIGPFKEEEETQTCIKKPLEKIGIKNPLELFERETYADVSEIHELSGGRPYEIQLICHFLFRRLQKGLAKRMVLSVEVLDDVREELENSQDVSIRPLLNAVRNYDEKQLVALDLLCSCNGHAIIEQIWFTEYVLFGEKRFTRQNLDQHLQRFVSDGILSTKNNIIKFSGDDFDRIYCKYWARKKDVPFHISDLSYEFHMQVSLNAFIRVKMKGNVKAFSPIIVGPVVKPDVQDFAISLARTHAIEDPFTTNPRLAEHVYWANLDFRSKESFQVVKTTFSSPWITVQQWHRCKSAQAAGKYSLNELPSKFSEYSHRAKELEGNLEFSIIDLPTLPVDELIQAIERSQNIELRRELGIRHYNIMGNAYIKSQDLNEAIFNGELAYRLAPKFNTANNLGYIYLVSENPDKAKEYLEKALDAANELGDLALANYNIGIAETKRKNFAEALVKFQVALEQARSPGAEYTIVCLIIPKSGDKDGHLKFEEVQEPEFIPTIESAINTIQQIIS